MVKTDRLNKKFANDLIYLKKSTIRKAGFGAFTKKDIAANTKLGEYKGKILSEREALALPNSKSHYLFEIKVRGGSNLFVDATSMRHSNWTRFINSVKQRHQRQKENVRYYQYKERIWIKTTRKIKQNEELIGDYGDEYWLENE